MKIGVLWYTRTGSTKLCAYLAEMFGVTNYNEELIRLISINATNEINAIRYSKNYCIKLLETMDPEWWKEFDLIVSTSRNSITDHYISNLSATNTGLWHRLVGQQNQEILPFALPTNDIASWPALNNLNISWRIEEVIGKKIVNFTYDEICDDKILIPKIYSLGFAVKHPAPALDIAPTGINYKKMCLNYTQIENAFALREDPNAILAPELDLSFYADQYLRFAKYKKDKADGITNKQNKELAEIQKVLGKAKQIVGLPQQHANMYRQQLLLLNRIAKLTTKINDTIGDRSKTLVKQHEKDWGILKERNKKINETLLSDKIKIEMMKRKEFMKLTFKIGKITSNINDKIKKKTGFHPHEAKK